MAPNRFSLKRRPVLGCLAAIAASAALAQSDPAPGPPRRVVFLAQDFRNGGITTVYRGFEEACQELGWKLKPIFGFSGPSRLTGRIALISMRWRRSS